MSPFSKQLDPLYTSLSDLFARRQHVEQLWQNYVKSGQAAPFDLAPALEYYYQHVLTQHDMLPSEAKHELMEFVDRRFTSGEYSKAHYDENREFLERPSILGSGRSGRSR